MERGVPRNGTAYTVKLVAIDSLGRRSGGVLLAGTPLGADEQALTLDGLQQTLAGFGQAVTVSIPIGAFPAGTSLWLRRLPAAELPSDPTLALVSPVWQVSAGDLAPGKPVYLILQYDGQSLGGSDPRLLGIYRQNPDQPGDWQYIGGVVDLLQGRLAATIDQLGSHALLSSQATYTDIAQHWARTDIELLAARHVRLQTAGISFQPNRPITRAEIASLLLQLIQSNPERVTELPVREVTPFTDVPEDAWCRQVAEQAVRLGLMVGADGLFRPDDLISRQKLAATLVRVLPFLGQPQTGNLLPLPFADRGQVSGWARSVVTIAWNHGLMSGVGGNRSAPWKYSGAAGEQRSASDSPCGWLKR